MKVIVIVSAIAEWNAVREIYPELEISHSPYGESSKLMVGEREVALFHSGWGKIASAGMMQYVIDTYHPDLIVNLGTCGGFEGMIEPGEVVLVDGTFIYDIVELMGDLNIKAYYSTSLDLEWIRRPYPHRVRRGILASADSDLPPEKIQFLKGEGAFAGDWESGALAWVAQKNGARLLILRGVTDLVNETAGEAYNNFALFEQRTNVIMRLLFEQLPDWLDAID